MRERRQAVRYRLGETADIVIFRDRGNLVVPLLDLSLSGLMAIMPDSEDGNLQPGSDVAGQLRRCGSVVKWRGRIIHRSPARYGIGVGIAYADDGNKALLEAIRAIVLQPDAGGVHLCEGEDGLILEVFGRLSFLTSRDSLGYLQRNAIGCIDLAHCCSVDSAGLSLLCQARARGIAIIGAHGAVGKLLAIARIIGPAETSASAWMPQHPLIH